MNIRPSEPRDEAAVTALWQACGLIRPWNDPAKDIARKRTVQGELFLVAEMSDAVIGCAMFGYDGHRGWVNYLAVAPDHQRRGIARALMAMGEERLTALGCPKLSLQVRSGNRAVVEFYHRLGYTTDDVVSLGKRLIPDV